MTKHLMEVPVGWCAGHFAALEKPELLMEDMRTFFADYH